MRSARDLLQFNFDADAFARRTPRPNAIPPERIAALERIMREHDGISEIPERENLFQIYHLFFNAIRTGSLHTEFDSLRRIRRLAWALTYSEDGLPRIVDTPELRDALQLIEDRFSISALLGVFHALLEVWGTRNAEMLREFVIRHLANYGGRRRFVLNLRANLAWYCEENGGTQLAMNLLRTQEKLSDVWSYLNLPDYMQGYRYFGAVAEAYVALNRHLDRESVADIVTFVEMHKDDRTNRAIVSRAIEELGIGASRGFAATCSILRSSGNGRIRDLLAGMCAGERFLMRHGRFLRDGLRKKIFAFSLMSLPKNAMIRSLPTEKPSGWRILNTSPSVVQCWGEMFTIFLETTHKPYNTTVNDNPQR